MDARALGLTAVSTLAASALVSLYAALELRPLFADGFHYFLRILERETFWLEAPARRTVELVRQLPVLAALKLGVGETGALARVFGLGIELFPLALTALCWPALPRGRRRFFAFPLLVFFAGTAGAAFAPIAEGPAAAAWFWLLFLLLLFRPPRGAWLALAAPLAAGTALLHEGMVLLAPILAVAAGWRARRAAGRGERFVFLALALWFAAVAAIQLDFLLDPARPDNRARYFTALVSLWWLFGLWGSLNLPALFGIAGLGLLGVVWARRLARMGAPQASARERQVERIAIAVFGVAALAAALEAIAADGIFAAQAQLNARNHPILVSVPLAALALFAAARPAARLPYRAAVVLCAWLAAASALWQAEAARRWADYIAVFREVLRERRGLVAWEDARARLPPAKRRLFEGFSHFWIEPTMSIVLAPGGRVAAIVAARREAGWYPFDARAPDRLPRSRFWTYDEYLAALGARR